MAFGAIIIGDEILSGRRTDKHLPKLIALLSARGLKLAWARYVGDDRGRLAETIRQSVATGDIVFSFGGIGATPDDHTRQAAAAALGVELALHPDAETALRARFGDQINDHRLQMGVFPAGSEIVPNPYNQVPGFSIRNHFFVPGFPVMAWPMVEWVLDTRFRHLHHAEDYVERAITVWDAYEGKLVDLMELVTAEFQGATLFCLPAFAEAGRQHSIELGMKGPAAEVAAAMERIKAEVGARGYAWQDKV